jgi:hypothetical protein
VATTHPAEPAFSPLAPPWEHLAGVTRSVARRVRTGAVLSRAVDLVVNVALLAGLWLAYAAVRGITADEVPTALANASHVLHLQRSLGLPSEAWLQQQVLPAGWLVGGANRFYLYVHFPVTGLALAWTWARRRELFGRLRTALIGVSAVALALHVAFPLAPPRMMPGFVDTGAVFGPSPYNLEAASAANQIAAMPSLHVGWALLLALTAVAAWRSWWRWLALVHPAVTAAVVVVTANHYWSDALVAAALVGVAWFLTGRRRNLLPRVGDGRTTTSLHPVPVELRPDLPRPALAEAA